MQMLPLHTVVDPDQGRLQVKVNSVTRPHHAIYTNVRSMGVRRKKRGNADILLIIFKLPTMQCKWTFTKRFTLSTPQRKSLMLR